MYSKVHVCDWFGDGKKDLILGTESNQIYFVRNIGTKEKPEFAEPELIPLVGLDGSYRCRVAVVDWNNDGKLDLLVGTFCSNKGMGGNVWLFPRK